MKILIVGAGGVGVAFGAPLQAGGNDVTYFARGEHAKAILKNGLSIEGEFSQTLRPSLATNLDDLTASYNLALLAVKCQDIPTTLSKLKSVLQKATTVLTLQNGIDAEEICAAHLPKTKIVGGVAYVDAFIRKPGVIKISRKPRCAMGDEDRLSKLFEKAGIPTKVYRDIRQTKWNKLSWNAVFNPLCLIHNKTVSEVRKDSVLKTVASKILGEISAVGLAEGIKIDPESVEKFFAYQDSQGSGNEETRTSMWADYSRGKPTEIDFLNGAIVRRGEKYRIPTPENEEIVRKVHEIEKTSPKL